MKRAVTLIEVLIGSLILATVFSGLLATFVAARKYVRRSNRRLVTGNLDRAVLGDLSGGVDANTWNANLGPLQTGLHPNAVNETIEGVNYLGNYTVVNSASGLYREVTVNVTYPE